jgi:hypothetical protein
MIHDSLTKALQTIFLLCFLSPAVLVAFWFIADGKPLRFYVLFVGIMSALYALYDIVDDLIFRKIHESDASQFARMCPIMGARAWGCLWLLIAFAFLAAAILAGLAVVSRAWLLFDKHGVDVPFCIVERYGSRTSSEVCCLPAHPLSG